MSIPSSKSDDLRIKIQNDVVQIISEKLESGDMSQERAKSIAEMVLAKLPEGASYEKLMEIIPTLDDHFSELSAAVLPVVVEYEQKVKEIVSRQITALIQQGKFDEAMQMTSQAIEFEKKLS